jgi:uncharacterized protein YuzE
MKVTYDADVDALQIVFNDGPVEESDESKPGVILDYSKDGKIIGMEILNASQMTKDPASVQFAVNPSTKKAI